MDDMVDMTTVIDRMWSVDMTCANVVIDTKYSSACHNVARLYRSTGKQKVKLWNQQHVLFCSFAIKETNFVLILVAHSLQFSEVAAATTNMTDLSRHEYDWRLWLSHINMTDSDLTNGGDLVTAAPGTSFKWLLNALRA